MSTTVELAKSFLIYCKDHPDQRFWQALRNWTGHSFIFAGPSKETMRDTFYERTPFLFAAKKESPHAE